MQRPFLKWAGGKYQIAERVAAALPRGSRLVEPFVGSGAVFLNTEFDSYLLSDTNADLIGVYRAVASEGKDFVRVVEELFTPDNNDESRFYSFREEFNSEADGIRKAALFVYLNRHCFNGLCRYNQKGQFNTPFGRYLKPYFPKPELLAFAKKSSRARFKVADFRVTFLDARPGDVYYCDPPYVPLTSTANFTSYSRGGFSSADQRRLAELARTAASTGVPVLLSNHDTPFVRELYADAEIREFLVQRFISAKTEERGRAPELLALYGARFESLATQHELWNGEARTLG
jgi:DNA adenine methylase